MGGDGQFACVRREEGCDCVRIHAVSIHLVNIPLENSADPGGTAPSMRLKARNWYPRKCLARQLALQKFDTWFPSEIERTRDLPRHTERRCQKNSRNDVA